MANPERGEVSLTVNGEDYTLKLSMNVAATLQGRHKKTIGVLLGECGDLDFVALRAVIWMLLQKYHKDKFPTEEKVGDFIDEAGGLPVFLSAINQVVAINQPEATADGKGSANPPMPGTGDSSMSQAAVSG